MNITKRIVEAVSNLSSSKKVEDDVVDLLVEKEKNRRVEAIVTGLSKLEELEKAHKKIDRPDSVQYDSNGQVVSESYTKARLEERNKSSKLMEKWKNVINKALEKGEMQDLYDMINKK